MTGISLDGVPGHCPGPPEPRDGQALGERVGSPSFSRPEARMTQAVERASQPRSHDRPQRRGPERGGPERDYRPIR